MQLGPVRDRRGGVEPLLGGCARLAEQAAPGAALGLLSSALGTGRGGSVLEVWLCPSSLWGLRSRVVSVP